MFSVVSVVPVVVWITGYITFNVSKQGVAVCNMPYCYRNFHAIWDHTVLHATNIGWWRGVVVSGVLRMNEVNTRRARLVLG